MGSLIRKFAILLLLNALTFQMVMTNIEDDCRKRYNFTKSVLEIEEEAPTPEKCFQACMMTRRGELSRDGKTYNLARGVEGIQECRVSTPEQKARLAKAAQACIGRVSPAPNICDTAHRYYMCRFKLAKIA